MWIIDFFPGSAGHQQRLRLRLALPDANYPHLISTFIFFDPTHQRIAALEDHNGRVTEGVA